MRDLILAAPRPAFAHPISVRFQDVDAAGLLFFGRFFDYFHDGYVAFMKHHGVGFAEAIAERSWAAPLKHVEADYLSPARFGDEIHVELVGKRVDGSLVKLFHRLRRGDRALAVARTDHVFVDLETFERVALPEHVRAALAVLPDL